MNRANKDQENYLIELMVQYHEDRISLLERRIHELEIDNQSKNYQFKTELAKHNFELKKITLIYLFTKQFLRSIKRKIVSPIRWLDIHYLRSSGMFNEEWYLATNPDVLRSNLDPIFHYVMYGSFEGRTPIDLKKYSLNIELKTQTIFQRNPYVRALKDRRQHLLPIRQNIEESEETSSAVASYAATQEDYILGFWYGLNKISNTKLYSQDNITHVEDAIYEAQTNNIVDKYSLANHDFQKDKFIKSILDASFFIDIDLYKEYEKCARSSQVITTYSIVTSFYNHINFFKDCISSILSLMQKIENHYEAKERVEWIILNDDPAVSEEYLLSLIPEKLRKITSITSDGKNLGIAVRLNQGIEKSKNEWVIFLDCDDLLESNCIAVLDHYIHEFPNARYISSCCIDVDDQNYELRRRRRRVGIESLLNQGMTAGHLVAVRRDLFDDLGKFDQRFSGCQDYDLVLRVLKVEPILLIPDHLYRYRWHQKTQSISNYQHQENTSFLVLINFLYNSINFSPRQKLSYRFIKDKIPRGVCFIRTQGIRNDLLQEAVESVLDQSMMITPCIIFHGDELSFLKFSEWGKQFGNKIELLHAPIKDLERGYPLNVGLDFLEKNPKIFDFFCILDDDDIYYRIFSERMVDELLISNSDVVYCSANSRIPGQEVSFQHEALPPSCLVAANFIVTNGFIVKTKFVLDNLIRFREDLRYLEDFEFLQSLLIAGAKFSYIPETLSEYRIIGDGNNVIKNDAVRYEHAKKLALARGALIAKLLGLNYFYRDLLQFGFGRINNLSPEKINEVVDVFKLFKLMSLTKN
jgi:glycosyltransferase involved in cell wall biosynthesis